MTKSKAALLFKKPGALSPSAVQGELMNYQTSNAARDITAHIGALELSALNAFDDSALEATIHAGPGPTMPPRPGARGCFGIDDGALETIVQVGPGPSGLTRFPACMPRIDDGELEATVHAGPSTHPFRSVRDQVD